MDQRYVDQRALDARISELELELIDLKRQRNALSPVFQLPPELLCKILSSNILTFVGDNFESLPANPRPTALTVCHVSHFWRALVRNTPQMWSYIRVGKNTRSQFLSFIWKKAETILVDMNVDSSEGESTSLGTPDAMDAIVEIIRQNPTKFRSLRLRLDIDPIRRVFGDFRGSFDHLQDLLISDPARDWGDQHSHDVGQYLVCQAPKLRRFWATGYTLPFALPLLSTDTLNIVRIYQNGGTMDHLFGLLRRCQSQLSSMDVGVNFPPPTDNLAPQGEMLELSLEDFHLQTSDWRTLVAILSRIHLSANTFSFSCGTIPDENTHELFSAIAHAHGSIIAPKEVRIRTNSIVTFWQEPITHPLANGTRRTLSADVHDELWHPSKYIETKGKVPFSNPRHYKSGWSFANLRVLTLAAGVPRNLWSVLAHTTPLEILRCDPSVDCYDVFDALRGTQDSSGSMPFPRLQAFVSTYGVPWNYNAYRRRKEAGFPSHVKGYHIDLADTLQARRDRFELASHKWEPLALLDFRKFPECDLSPDELDILRKVAKEVVWEKRGWWVENLDYEP
jgi:hypothetical protein